MDNPFTLWCLETNLRQTVSQKLVELGFTHPTEFIRLYPTKLDSVIQSSGMNFGEEERFLQAVETLQQNAQRTVPLPKVTNHPQPIPVKQELPDFGASPVPVPPYWSIASIGLVDKSTRIERDVSIEMRPIFQHLIDKMTKLDLIWKGRDVLIHGDPGPTIHTGYQVMQVTRIEHPKLWIPFANQKDDLKRKPINTKIQSEILFPLHELDSDVNECYMFHASKKQFVTSITETGFNEKYSPFKDGQLGGMFGQAVRQYHES